jgi:hypothetical protein
LVSQTFTSGAFHLFPHFLSRNQARILWWEGTQRSRGIGGA